MSKTLKKIIILFLFLVAVMGTLYYDATVVAPSRFVIRYETFRSNKIPPQLNDVTLLFFSDVHYDHFMDEVRFEKLITLIEKASPDVIVFLGDLLYTDSTLQSSEEISTLQNQLNRLEAPLGKFAILGDTDLQSFSRKELVSSLLQNSGFEIITNQAIHIRNKGAESISLVGMDSLLNGTPLIQDTFSSVSSNLFTLVIAHEPDLIEQLPTNLIDLQVSGHSLGGQVFFPLLGPTKTFEGAQRYQRGKYTVASTRLDITNGVGTLDEDIRFLTNAEVVLYTLKRIEKPLSTPTSTLQPTLPVETPSSNSETE